MTRLEQIEFENWAKFQLALEKTRDKQEAFRTYKNKDNENKTSKIISNNHLYLGNNLSLGIFQADSGKVYVSIEYFSIDDRFKIAKAKNTNFKSANEI